MTNYPIDMVVETLEKESSKWDVPVVTLIAIQEKDPFKVLMSTIISLRTKDEVTIESSRRLYKILQKPQDIYDLSIEDIEKAIYPAGFYRTKARNIISICKKLVEEFDSKVPKDIDTLLTLPGVGRKTANLVLSEGYGLAAMCVDVHVHRISNRLGYISTKDPEESEWVLRERLPKKYWIQYNSLLVAFGQSTCRPVSPFCSKCPVAKWCQRVGVTTHR